MKIKAKRPNRIVHPFKRKDRIEMMMRRIAAKIDNDGELQAASMSITPYARQQWIEQIAPYLKFKTACVQMQ